LLKEIFSCFLATFILSSELVRTIDINYPPMACWLASNHSVDARLRLSRVQFPVLAKVSPHDVKYEKVQAFNEAALDEIIFRPYRSYIPVSGQCPLARAYISGRINL
jgi:hypothetical protein